MNWYTKLYIAILTGIMAMSSCGPVKDCDEIGNNFYKTLKDKEFNTITQFLDEEALKYTPENIWTDGLIKKDNSMGMILNIERKDFETQTIDNVTRVAIKYKVTYTNGTLYERLEFIERSKNFKITYYRYDEDSTMVN